MGGVIQSVDKGQFVKYFLSLGVCQRIAICNNMDKRMPDVEKLFLYTIQV